MTPQLARSDGLPAPHVDMRALLGEDLPRWPFCMRILAENVARQHLSGKVSSTVLASLLDWHPGSAEIVVPMEVTRLIFPDSSGLPALMDLAAARDVVAAAGGDPRAINPVKPITLVVDHSLIVDVAGHPNAREKNVALEYERNRERYAFFKWAEQAFDNFRVVPPGMGIIHQVHLEALARVVDSHPTGAGPVLAPEFVLGCDSHTPMVGGLGVLGWGVGGIDGEAAALGQPYLVRVPQVVGVVLSGALPAGSTTTDLVLTITERLRERGVVGAFLEFVGPGAASLSVPERATIANMAPEFGATAAYFPIDARTIDYLRQSGREEAHVALVEAHARAAGFWREDGAMPDYTGTVEIDLRRIVPSVSGPRRPQDRIALSALKDSFRTALARPREDGGFGLAVEDVDRTVGFRSHALGHGAVVIAAITACTNTSNPSVMLAAGLLARNAVARGLAVPPWVKTSLAPGSRLVSDYLAEEGLMAPLEALGFHVVGYGCTTCSGKSGPLDTELAGAIREGDLVATAVLSGNRNFEGRIHKAVRGNYLASPPLVVAFALAGRVDVDFETEPLGRDPDGAAVFLRDIWPDPEDLDRLVKRSQRPDRFRASYATLFDGTALWDRLQVPRGALFDWDPASTYIRRPPFFELDSGTLPDRLEGLRVLVRAGDSLTTDHITPSGEISPDSEAGRFLIDAGVAPRDFNAVTQRRGNHDFMARVTFANPRMVNLLAGGREGGWTRLEPEGDILSIHAAAERLRGTPLMVLAGRDYGMGSSRDWAAKGPALLGVRVVLAENFERIHRANLIGMGIVPLVFAEDGTAEDLGLTGFEHFDIDGLRAGLEGAPVKITATGPSGAQHFTARIDIAAEEEAALLRNGGLFRSLISGALAEGQTGAQKAAAP